MTQLTGWQRAKQWLGFSSLRADTTLNPNDDSLYVPGFASYGTASGQRVSPEHAMRLAAVYACVRVISETIASLPFIIYKRLQDGGRERATDHPLYDVLRKRTNATQTAFEYFETNQLHLELRGNGFALINPGPRGAIDNLVPIHPDRVKVFRLDTGRVRYEISDWYTGKVVAKSQDEILHFRGQSEDGLVGRGAVAHSRETVGIGLALQEYAARFFENDSKPPVVMKIPTVTDAITYARLRKSWQESQTGENRHKIAVLEGGAELQEFGATNKDSQFLEAREFIRAEVCGLYRVPPHKIGDLTKATFSNIEEQNIEFVTDCIVPRATRLEQRINMDLIEPLELEGGDEYFGEFLLDNLLRGNLKSRYEAYTQGRNAGFLSINDIRKRENMNPLNEPGADEYLRPMNFVPIDTPADQAKAQNDPAQTPGKDDTPDPETAT